jgi:deazaflavin-dependent oxidoreductase (nitroreductase family)
MSWAAEHTRQYLASSGADVDHPHADRLILLYTRGRRSGIIRRIPLVHLAAGGDRYVVASAGGSPRHPAWYRNLKAHPDVWVRDKEEFFPAVASEVEGHERESVWERIVDAMPFFGGYQAKVDRQIPVIRLTRVG